jgi:hypothetical protein
MSLLVGGVTPPSKYILFGEQQAPIKNLARFYPVLNLRMVEKADHYVPLCRCCRCRVGAAPGETHLY